MRLSELLVITSSANELARKHFSALLLTRVSANGIFENNYGYGFKINVNINTNINGVTFKTKNAKEFSVNVGARGGGSWVKRWTLFRRAFPASSKTTLFAVVS